MILCTLVKYARILPLLCGFYISERTFVVTLPAQTTLPPPTFQQPLIVWILVWLLACLATGPRWNVDGGVLNQPAYPIFLPISSSGVGVSSSDLSWWISDLWEHRDKSFYFSSVMWTKKWETLELWKARWALEKQNLPRNQQSTAGSWLLDYAFLKPQES